MDNVDLTKELEIFEYKEMDDSKKAEVQIIKECAAGLLRAFNKALPGEERSDASRLMNIARTNLEQTIMWAVKAVSRK